MAKQRIIQTKFRSDPYIQELEPETKLLYLYLLTNERTNIAGIYELSLKTMSFEIGYPMDILSKGIDTLSKDGKIMFVQGWVIIKNFMRHQNTKSKKVIEGIKNVVESLPGYLMDTLSISYDTLSISFDTLSYTLTLTSTPTKTSTGTQTGTERTDSPPPPQEEEKQTLTTQEEKNKYIQTMRAVDTKGNHLIDRRNEITGRNDLMDESTKKRLANIIQKLDVQDFDFRVHRFLEVRKTIENESLIKFIDPYANRKQDLDIAAFLKKINLFSDSLENILLKVVVDERKPNIKRLFKPRMLQARSIYLDVDTPPEPPGENEEEKEKKMEAMEKARAALGKKLSI